MKGNIADQSKLDGLQLSMGVRYISESKLILQRKKTQLDELQLSMRANTSYRQIILQTEHN